MNENEKSLLLGLFKQDQKEVKDLLQEVQVDLAKLATIVESRAFSIDKIDSKIEALEIKNRKQDNLIYGNEASGGIISKLKEISETIDIIKIQQVESSALSRQRTKYVKWLWAGIGVLGVSNVIQYFEILLNTILP